jgi:hypothetical protein
MSFEGQTTRKKIFVGNITRPTGGGASTPLEFPRTGILSAVHVLVTGSISGTLSSPNPGGMASIIRRARLVVQGGQDLVNVSGVGYHYLYRPWIDMGLESQASQSAYAAVTATTFDVSMIFPIQVNQRDHAGLFNLQNEQTLMTLNLDFEADATVATGATVTATTKVYADIFTLPPDPKDRPDMSFIHQVLEDQKAISAAGIHNYEWPRGSIYLRMLHGLGLGQSGSDLWSAFQVKRNESDVLVDYQDTVEMDKSYNFLHGGAARKPGTMFWSGIDHSGLGAYGMARDTIDSARLTNIKSFFTATGAGTLYAVRDTLLDLKRG